MKVRIRLKVNEDCVCFVRMDLSPPWICNDDSTNC